MSKSPFTILASLSTYNIAFNFSETIEVIIGDLTNMLVLYVYTFTYSYHILASLLLAIKESDTIFTKDQLN